MQQLRGVILLVNQDHKIVTASPGAIGLERAIGFGEAGTQNDFPFEGSSRGVLQTCVHVL
jgi:hypothetical protein